MKATLQERRVREKKAGGYGIIAYIFREEVPAAVVSMAGAVARISCLIPHPCLRYELRLQHLALQ